MSLDPIPTPIERNLLIFSPAIPALVCDMGTRLVVNQYGRTPDWMMYIDLACFTSAFVCIGAMILRDPRVKAFTRR